MPTATAEKKQPNQVEEDSFQNKIEDYLTGPRRKKRNYVILALSKSFDENLKQFMLLAISKNYPELAVTLPSDREELTREFSRNISLLIIDDEFDGRSYLLKLISALKHKLHESSIPVLFFTANVKALIESYNHYLLPYQEVDEYIDIKQINTNRIMKKIRDAIDFKNNRRSRRFQTAIDIRIFRLSLGKWINGRIVDISLHGATLESSHEDIFRNHEQIKVAIPTTKLIDHPIADWFKLSARVRHIFIAGTKIAVSFEHMTVNQKQCMHEIITKLAHDQFKIQSRAIRRQEAKEEKS